VSAACFILTSRWLRDRETQLREWSVSEFAYLCHGDRRGVIPSQFADTLMIRDSSEAAGTSRYSSEAHLNWENVE
jgi:hypothetical protein